MLLRMNDWEKIREKFSPAEKEVLNNAISANVICPQGAILNLDKLGETLKQKLEESLLQLKGTPHANKMQL
jgi:hypothetical protein